MTTLTTRLLFVPALAATFALGIVAQVLAGDVPVPNTPIANCEKASGYLLTNYCNPSGFPAGRFLNIENGRLPDDDNFHITGNTTAHGALYCRRGSEERILSGPLAPIDATRERMVRCDGGFATKSFCGQNPECANQ